VANALPIGPAITGCTDPLFTQRRCAALLEAALNARHTEFQWSKPGRATTAICALVDELMHYRSVRRQNAPCTPNRRYLKKSEIIILARVPFYLAMGSGASNLKVCQVTFNCK